MPAKRLTPVARRLRRDRTEVEDKLWAHLRDRRLGGAKFRFQAPLAGHVADFACIEARLVVELDGGHHAARAETDAHRTRSLEQAGYAVLRFWNNDVLTSPRSIGEAILSAARESGAMPNNPTPDPSPQGGGERADASREVLES